MQNSMFCCLSCTCVPEKLLLLTLATTNLSSSLTVLSFPECHMNRSTQYIAFRSDLFHLGNGRVQTLVLSAPPSPPKKIHVCCVTDYSISLLNSITLYGYVHLT